MTVALAATAAMLHGAFLASRYRLTLEAGRTTASAVLAVALAAWALTSAALLTRLAGGAS